MSLHKSTSNESVVLPPEIEMPVRVQYYETDRMGVVHHSNYARYFEMARMEQFRRWGHPYGSLESSGCFLMITDLQCKCRAPARFDDLLQVRVWVERMTRYRIFHRYEIKSELQVVATGGTTLASVDQDGMPAPLPDFSTVDSAARSDDKDKE